MPFYFCTIATHIWPHSLLKGGGQGNREGEGDLKQEESKHLIGPSQDCFILSLFLVQHRTWHSTPVLCWLCLPPSSPNLPWASETSTLYCIPVFTCTQTHKHFIRYVHSLCTYFIRHSMCIRTHSHFTYYSHIHVSTNSHTLHCIPACSHANILLCLDKRNLSFQQAGFLRSRAARLDTLESVLVDNMPDPY